MSDRDPDPLSGNLDEARRLVSETLAAARAELVALEERKTQLVALIARTEAMNDAIRADRPLVRPLTLHEAIAMLINENGNRWTSIKELAATINSRQLYRKRDGSPVELNQVHARINNYEYLFEKSGARVRLRVVP